MLLRLANKLGSLRYRWRHGEWCQHSDWTKWVLADLGRRKVRWDKGCGWTEVI